MVKVHPGSWLQSTHIFFYLESCFYPGHLFNRCHPSVIVIHKDLEMRGETSVSVNTRPLGIVMIELQSGGVMDENV